MRGKCLCPQPLREETGKEDIQMVITRAFRHLEQWQRSDCAAATKGVRTEEVACLQMKSSIQLGSSLA